MSNDILANMTKMAGIVAEEIKNQARSNRVPDVDKALSISSATMNQDKTEVRIRIIIDTSENGAPAAGAFEWGSGERATVGPTNRIKIEARNVPKMSWPKADWPQYDPNYYSPPRPQPDWHTYRKVEHPGVFPRSYIRPSINMHMLDIIQLVGQGAVAEIMSRMKQIEKITIEV